MITSKKDLDTKIARTKRMIDLFDSERKDLAEILELSNEENLKIKERLNAINKMIARLIELYNNLNLEKGFARNGRVDTSYSDAEINEILNGKA